MTTKRMNHLKEKRPDEHDLRDKMKANCIGKQNS
jgi:hypothetical protein